VIEAPLFEFHVSREVRDFYSLDETLFAQTGNVVFTDFYRVRIFANQMNRKRELVTVPGRSIKAGSLNAMGLIDEILHFVVGLYKKQKNITLFADAERWVKKKINAEKYEEVLKVFTEKFPPLSVYRNEISSDAYLKEKTAGISNRQIVLEEILLLHLANANPAFAPFKELFDDDYIGKKTDYRQFISSLEEFFEGQPTFGPDHQTLAKLLHTPALKFPQSLSAQLEFIRQHWGYMLSDYIFRLLSSLDLIKEEEKPVFAGAGPLHVPDFRSLSGEEEPERFSTDLDWMPNVVMIAKSTYVWLDQLSKKYSRAITTLDQIPDGELDLLANRGFTALWLIGLWERSSASQKIKQMCGNPEAVSSAYSLFDYAIALDLGGERAFENLRTRAWRRGIRIASDMVPNHTGIYSKWVIEHPDWFVKADHPVFPSYSFNGSNLSEDNRVAIYIEDGYWNQTDAAVLFKRVDTFTGSVNYIYHGNDGTSMPWNDTAQLNFLIPELREAVIQTILHVARKFPIIRLDAAMTLAKKHFQRLWFPQPGSGGDIPSRAQFSVTKEKFEQLFPVEFWREVVDRVAQEVPDTLLLAEAFWMMEGYFVRTLGMHRVYNSAFMNMLKSEENQKYRQAIKSVMEFNPEIMKRYVNFMNNPDEETAVAQFGKDDKYFGICTLMVTLPGLPMFGHGQIEGFTEKYGMEYKRAYWDDSEDHYLIERHEREIFPLLKKRYLFSQVNNFILYDLMGPEGFVNEDVFAFTNRTEREKSLVLYNNRYERSSGWIKYSSASAEKSGDHFKSYILSEGLSVSNTPHTYTIFRDQISNLEYIRNNSELEHHGLYVELDGFKYHVFLDFREIQDNEYNHYAQLTHYLAGRGVPSIDEALKETFLTPVHQPLNYLLDIKFLKKLETGILESENARNIETELLKYYQIHFSDFIGRIKEFTSATGKEADIINDRGERFRYLLYLKDSPKFFKIKKSVALKKTMDFIADYSPSAVILMIWLTVSDLGKLQDKNYAPMISVSWLDEFLLNKKIDQSLQLLAYDEYSSAHQLLLIRILTMLPDWMNRVDENPGLALETLFQYHEVQKLLGVNKFQDILYFHYESLIELLAAFYSIAIINLAGQKTIDKNEIKDKLIGWYKHISRIIEAARDNNSRIYLTIEAVKDLRE
jgi:glycosidase